MCTCQINLYSIDIMLILLKIQSKRYNNNGIQSTCQMSCYLLKFELDFVNNKWQKKNASNQAVSERYPIDVPNVLVFTQFYIGFYKRLTLAAKKIRHPISLFRRQPSHVHQHPPWYTFWKVPSIFFIWKHFGFEIRVTKCCTWGYSFRKVLSVLSGMMMMMSFICSCRFYSQYPQSTMLSFFSKR